MIAIQKFKSYYTNLDTESVQKLREIYTDDIVFIDPVTEHKGLKNLEAYFSGLLQDTQTCVFEIREVSPDATVIFVTWQMTFSHPKIKAGTALKVDGVSELMIRGDKICFQRDYYDMGEMIYQHIPVLGSVIRLIKKRLCR